MVREATLRLGVDARGAKQSLDDFRRSGEQVNITVQQTTVSTDRLEKKLDLLTVATRMNARNTALMADSMSRLGQANDRAATSSTRATSAMARQSTIGEKLNLVFGELASKTAATGGAFLAADFLARVAGATSLMDALNRALNSAAKATRELVSGQESFNEAVISGSRKAAPELDEYLGKLSEFVSGQGSPRVFLGGSRQFNENFVALPAGADQNPFFARQIGEAFDAYQSQIRERIRSGAGSIGSGPREQLQATLLRIGEEFTALQRNVRAWEEEDKRAMDAATRRAREWAAALERGAAIQGRRDGQAAAGRFGASIATPFAVAGIQAAQSYANQQFYAGIPASNGGGGLGGDTAFFQGIVNLSARYAANVAVIAQRHQEAARSGERMGQAIASSFEDAIFNARSLEEGLEQVARAAVRAAFSEIVTANLASSLAGLFGSTNATGNVFSAGNVVPFASGGVVSGPVTFPMAGGKRGLMGEAGPEAIMPLGRNAKGELGVKGGGQVINFYISTQDASSFGRSQRQITQMARKALRS